MIVNHIGIYGICIKDNGLLCIRKEKGPYRNRFDLPGGSQKEHEGFTETLIREFKEETGYTVVFPDLNWLSTCGETLEEALAMAIDCLAGYLYTCEKEDIVFPSPSKMEKVNLEGIAEQLEISVKESFINIVSVCRKL